MQNIVTIQNVADIDFSVLMELLREIYCRDLPVVDLNTPPDIPELENLMVFFAAQYALFTELWAKMSHEVRLLKRTSKDKDSIDEAIGKRDYLSQILSAIKLKYYSSKTMLQYHSRDI